MLYFGVSLLFAKMVFGPGIFLQVSILFSIGERGREVGSATDSPSSIPFVSRSIPVTATIAIVALTKKIVEQNLEPYRDVSSGISSDPCLLFLNEPTDVFLVSPSFLFITASKVLL
jgi:hypothetical protein